MDDGTVAAIDVASGHLVWRALLALGPMGALAPAGDLLLMPAIGPRGGIVAFAHDPAGHLTDETSPSQLDLVGAVANFGGAFLVMTALILGLFRLLAHRGGPGEPMGVPTGVRVEEDEET